MISKCTKPGTKVRVINNITYHDIPVGTIVTIDSIRKEVHENGKYFAEMGESGNYRSAYLEDLEPIKTKSNLELEVQSLKCQQAELELQIQFLNESGLDEFNEREYNVFQLLNKMESRNTTLYEAVKAIIKLCDETK